VEVGNSEQLLIVLLDIRNVGKAATYLVVSKTASLTDDLSVTRWSSIAETTNPLADGM
jgi:hypothetical protein